VCCEFGHARMMHHMHQHVKPIDAPCAFERAMHNMHALGMNLARIRKAKGLNQRDLAEMVGVDQATIQRAETMHSSAKLETYQRCADALGVTLEDLFAGSRDEKEAVLVSTFRRIPEEMRVAVLAMLDVVQKQSLP
jgi:transcriptional regulator with XRE-family HTH domain